MVSDVADCRIAAAAGIRCGLYTSPHLLSWCERLPQGRGHVVHMTPWNQDWPPPQGLDEEAWTLQAATAVNRAMEGLILRRPSQYLWGYHRYKQPRATL